jgi:SAM-dependent methyltransferase
MQNDLAEYASERPQVFGKWLAKSSSIMKDFLKKHAKNIKPEVTNRYEENGAWFLPYLSMRSDGVDRHFANVVKGNFPDFYANISKIVSKFPHRQLCLDIGCATGILTRKLAAKYGFVIGMDQSFSFMKEARTLNKYSNAEFVVADALHLPFKSRFDAVVSLNLLDLVDPKKFLGNIYHILKPNGMMILTDPYDFRDERGNPRKLYDGKSIRKLLSSLQFSIDRSTAKESFIPWILRVYERAYLVYFADIVIAKKD